MRRAYIGAILALLPFLLSSTTEGQPSKSTAGAPAIDKAAPAKVETATLALG